MQSDATTLPLSLIICTYNRGDILGETLASYATLAAATAVRAELLIVDNHSSDATARIAREFVAGRSDARYLFEATPGLSHARNTGIKEARGEIIAFADDDVFFEPGWLDALMRVFTDFPEAGCVGGRTQPYFETGTPPWLHQTLLYMFGATNSGDVEAWMNYPKHPFGVNMAFRREVFQRIGWFDPRLGRIGDSLLSGEESDIFRRVHEAGIRTRYTPDAFLRHRIPASRTDPDWVLKRSYWQGISDVVFRQLHEPLGRLDLLRQALADAGWMLKHHTGGHLSPRAILWNHTGLPLHARSWSEIRRGRIRQALKEALSRSTKPYPPSANNGVPR
ncbi:MAG: glycosyltransferase family A protein [Sulfuricellaceae bacterium]|nr:glycosyltransferase family A protein [Sulfuricellaceae bacterium]